MKDRPQVFDLQVKACARSMMAVRDTLDILSGRWKITIIVALQLPQRYYQKS
jgi:DNA-binding HxlR family transcriptional regulator